MKRITLCADDYGQNTAISQAIIELLQKNRLSATSCMTNSYYWLSHAKWLNPHIDQADIGLHFNLTMGKPLSKELGSRMMPHSKLIVEAFTGRLSQSAIESELQSQLDHFIRGLGREPSFIDGHQHVHQLPIIRDAFLNVYEKRLRKTGCYIRSVYNPGALLQIGSSAYVKKIIIQLCGASTFKKALTKLNIPHNTSFSGIYNFNDANKFPALFDGFLNQISDDGIIMCHPGLSDSDDDSIVKSRILEYVYFNSERFTQDCARHQIKLEKFKL